MKTYQSAWVRALCSIVVGVLLIMYREQTMTWLTIAIGVLFLVSGAISCASYVAARRAEPVVSGDDSVKAISTAHFPIVGIGSLVLGIILAFMPGTFVNGLMYILAVILMLGAVGQFVALASATRMAHVGLFFWVMPTLIFLVGLVALVKPSWVASAPLLVLGWCMLLYGLTESLNTIQLWRLRKQVEKASMQTEAEAATIETVAQETTENAVEA